MPTKFIILHHQVTGGEHWDLMLEQGEGLLTWQLLREPISRSHLPIQARRIGNHRKDYLTYEGPLSGDRGGVRRVDAGTVNYEHITTDHYVIRLEGRRLLGLFTLISQGDLQGDQWLFDVAASPDG